MKIYFNFATPADEQIFPSDSSQSQKQNHLNSSRIASQLKYTKYALLHPVDTNQAVSIKFEKLKQHYDNNSVVDSELNARTSNWSIKACPQQYPLHQAVINQDYATAKQILQSGYNANTIDELNSTALHVAALTNQPEMIKLLLNYGADPHIESYYGYYPIEVAYLENNAAAVQQLLPYSNSKDIQYLQDDHICYIYDLMVGCQLTPCDKMFSEIDKALDVLAIFPEATNSTVISFAFEPISEPIASLYQFFASIAPTEQLQAKCLLYANQFHQADNNADIYFNSKALTHIFQLSGTYKVNFDDKYGNKISISVDAEGHDNCFTAELFQKSFENYMKYLANSGADLTTQEIYQDCTTIINNQSFYATNGGLLTTSERAFSKYLNNETIMLPSGWDGHAVNVIIDQSLGLFIIGNCGERFWNFESGCTVFNMHHPENLSADLIYQIINNRTDYNLEYRLHYELGLEESGLLQEPDQISGNCAWQSICTGFEGLLYINFLKMGLDHTTAVQQANNYYQNWHEYQVHDFLQEYLSNDPRIEPQALFDIMQEYCPSLFYNQKLDVTEQDLQHAELIVQALNANYTISPHYLQQFLANSHAKPELKIVFADLGLTSQIPTRLELEEVIDNAEISDNCCADIVYAANHSNNFSNHIFEINSLLPDIEHELTHWI